MSNGALSPFVRGKLEVKPRDFIAQQMSLHGLSRQQAKVALDKLLSDEVHVNDEYQVNIDKNAPHGFSGVRVWHLSIKRRDKAPVHDWRDLQAIKNALCGPEAEAVELYPAESRLVDSANQYHLHVFMPADGEQPMPRVPLGWTQRLVTEQGIGGGVQRPMSQSPMSQRPSRQEA